MLYAWWLMYVARRKTGITNRACMTIVVYGIYSTVVKGEEKDRLDDNDKTAYK